MNARGARTLRGLAAGSTATVVAATSHGLSGGTFPGLAGIALALTFSAMVSIALMGRRMPVVRLAASIGLSQLAFHLLFSTIGGPSEAVVSGGHHGAVVFGSTSGAHVMSHTSAGMWLAHGIAAALTLLALVYGEHSITAVRSTARMLLTRILPANDLPVPHVARPLCARSALHLVPRAARELVASCGLRGPPLDPSVA